MKTNWTMETWGIITLKSSGQRVMIYKKQSWGKTYYSFDGDNWGDRKSKALAISRKLIPAPTKTHLNCKGC